MTKEATELLINYDWPGNIRELKNVIESAVALSKTGLLDVDSFVPLLSVYNEDEEYRNLPVHVNRPPELLDREMIYRALIEIKKDLIDLKQLALRNEPDISNQSTYDNKSAVIPLDELEKQAIINALKQTQYNRRKAAKLLNISERTLYRKLKEYNIE